MRSLRLPLGVGVGALQALATGFVLVPIGIGMLGCFVVFVWYAEDFNDGLAYIGGGILGTIAWGWIKLRRAWHYRPSDAVFRDDCLAIEGGPHHGATFSWDSIRADNVRVREKTDDKGKDKRWVLGVGGTDVAESDEEIEGESLREVATAIRSRVSEDEEAPAKEKPAEILACNKCGAPIAPTAETTTTCSHCHEKVEVPKDVRERVAASSTLTKQGARAEKLVTKLLDQPGAGSTTALLWLSFIVIGSAWPITIWAYMHLYEVQELTFARGALLATVPFLVIADGFFLSRLRLVDRRALGSLVMTFGAQPPAHAGEPLRCRSCMGPLPERTAVVVQCIYCDASNVTGVDLRANARRATQSAASLWNALEQRARDRRTWRWRTLASIPFFVIVPLLVRDAFKAKEEVWTFESTGAHGWQPRLSPDGTTVLHQTKDGWALLDLATRQSAATHLQPGTTRAAWLPDGRIACFSYADIIASDGQMLVKNVGLSANRLAVSPDGTHVAVVDIETTIYKIGGSKEERIDVHDADYTSDGNLLGRDSKGVAVFTHGKRTKVSDVTGSDWHASPDGKRVVFLHEGTLRIMSSTGSKKKTLMKDCGNCKDLRWEHDGNLYFVRDAEIWRGKP